jgi:hypothetical protein
MLPTVARYGNPGLFAGENVLLLRNTRLGPTVLPTRSNSRVARGCQRWHTSTHRNPRR